MLIANDPVKKILRGHLLEGNDETSHHETSHHVYKVQKSQVSTEGFDCQCHT